MHVVATSFWNLENGCLQEEAIVEREDETGSSIVDKRHGVSSWGLAEETSGMSCSLARFATLSNQMFLFEESACVTTSLT